VKKPVTNTRFMDTSGLRVRNIKCLVFRVSISFFSQIPMKRQNVLHQVSLKNLNVLSGPFTINKLSPRLEEIFGRNDMLIAMNKLDFSHNHKVIPPQLLPILQKVKSAYLQWYGYYQTLPKLHRHSLGQKVDTLFVEIIEGIAIASYLPRAEKQPWVRLAIRKLDTLKIFLMLLWETKSLDNKQYIAISEYVSEVGKMLGGWNGQLSKQNSPVMATREK